MNKISNFFPNIPSHYQHNYPLSFLKLLLLRLLYVYPVVPSPLGGNREQNPTRHFLYYPSPPLPEKVRATRLELVISCV